MNEAIQAGAEIPPSANGKRKRLLILAVLFFALAAAVVFTYWYFVLRHYESTDDAYVAGNVVQVTPQTNGTVVGIYADDTDFVPEGKVLVKLDPTDADVALKQAEAQLAQAVRQARQLYANNDALAANMRERQAELARMQHDVDKARDDLQRREAVAAMGAVSKEEVEHARTALDNALSALAATQSSLVGARQQLASGHALTEGTTVASHPSVQAAAARVREAYLARARCDIAAPVAGQVARRNVQIGQRIATGAPLMAVVPLREVWVEANFKENQLGRMRIGQPVELHADIYGNDVEYRGQVLGLGAGTGAAFSLLPAQNATGNWIKVVQRLPVRVALDREQLKAHPLRVGLSMDVEVDIEDSHGTQLSQSVRQTPVATTSLMSEQAATAEALVARIISVNLGGNAASAKAKPGSTGLAAHTTHSQG